ncbi:MULTISPECIES: hypothetical protein [unclassified Brenneria]|uniref:hypothetical protein n=1 Tax=unclassified Brenneria TaxID=2634434 RepID=UPI0029C45806|nr:MULTISPECIES: hypothetical protein [unclassified Brenneria]MDX5629031.1 hypothetical protein [Brenneria sp. L3-3Z]MDX5696170.1 hypothetical protein [Brenneria sp. L4-2C]MEE3660981.1 hypothetical protein [Brenneria sp. g21c3]
MKPDRTLYPHTVAVFIFALFLPYIGPHFLAFSPNSVDNIELFQSCFLLFGAIFTWFYIKPLRCDKERRIFWLWSISWWILLFGRGVDWGRIYLPDVPRIYFRAISVVLIAITVLMLLHPAIRREIVRRFRTETIPVWDAGLVVVYFLIADTIEHHRLLSFLFLYDVQYKDLMEELYELPFMFSLFFVAFYLQKREKRVSSVCYS